MNLFDSIANEDILKLPLRSFEGNIHVIDTQEECTKALQVLRQESMIGFDTETKPAFIKGGIQPYCHHPTQYRR